MRIGILCACSQEFEPFKSALGENSVRLNGLIRCDGTLAGHEVSAVFCGIGKVNAALGAVSLIRDCGAERVIMCGVAGAIADGLHIGQCIMITDCIYHDLEASLLRSYQPGTIDPDFVCAEDMILLGRDDGMLCGRTVTGDVFIADEGRSDIIARFDPLCCDMETAAAAHVCSMYGVAFNCLRAISDTEDESGLGSFEKNVEFAAKNAFDGLCRLLEKL